MIKQKRNQKVTEQNKKRVNLFKLQERVESLEKQLALQLRINANQVAFNDMRVLNEDVTYKNIKQLSDDVIVLKQSKVKRLKTDELLMFKNGALIKTGVTKWGA